MKLGEPLVTAIWEDCMCHICTDCTGTLHIRLHWPLVSTTTKKSRQFLWSEHLPIYVKTISGMLHFMTTSQDISAKATCSFLLQILDNKYFVFASSEEGVLFTLPSVHSAECLLKGLWTCTGNVKTMSRTSDIAEGSCNEIRAALQALILVLQRGKGLRNFSIACTSLSCRANLLEDRDLILCWNVRPGIWAICHTQAACLLIVQGHRQWQHVYFEPRLPSALLCACLHPSLLYRWPTYHTPFEQPPHKWPDV